MVSHQRTCVFSTDTPKDGADSQQNPQQTIVNKRPSLEITAVNPTLNQQFNNSNQTPPEKRMKIVLNGESLKEFVMSKDLSEVDRWQTDPPQLKIVPIKIGTVDNNNFVGEYNAALPHYIYEISILLLTNNLFSCVYPHNFEFSVTYSCSLSLLTELLKKLVFIKNEQKRQNKFVSI